MVRLLLSAPLAGLGGLGLCLGAGPAAPPSMWEPSAELVAPKLEQESTSTGESGTPPRSTTRTSSENAALQEAVARGLTGLSFGQSPDGGELGGAGGSGGINEAPLIPINPMLNPQSDLADGDGVPDAEGGNIALVSNDPFEDCEVTYEVQHPGQRFLAPVPASSGTGYSTAPAPRVRLVCDSLTQFEERSPSDRARDARALLNLNKGRGLGRWQNHWTEVENGKIASGHFERVGLVKPANTGGDPVLERSRAALKALKGGPESEKYDWKDSEKRREYRSAYSSLQREIDVVSHIQRELADPQEQGGQGGGYGGRTGSNNSANNRESASSPDSSSGSGSSSARSGSGSPCPVQSGSSSTGATTLEKIKSIYEWVETRVRRQRAANGLAPAQSWGGLPALPEDLRLPHPRDVSVLLYQANYGDREAEKSFFKATFIWKYGAERGPDMFRKKLEAFRPWTANQFCARKDLHRFMRNYASYDQVPKLDDATEQAVADEKWRRMSPLEWRASLGKRWIVGMFTGLLVFRQCGVVHRDMRPQNFGVGKDFELKYTGFGLAEQKEMGSLKWGKNGAGATTSGVSRPEAAPGPRQTGRHLFNGGTSTADSYTGAVEQGVYGASSILPLSSFLGSYVDFQESDADPASGCPSRSSQPGPESLHAPEVGDDHFSGTQYYMGPPRGLNKDLMQRVCEFFDSREDVYAAMMVTGEILSWVGFSGFKRHWNMGKLSTADVIQRYYWVIKGIERLLKEGGLEDGHEAFEIVRMGKAVAAFAIDAHEVLDEQAMKSDTRGKPTKTRAPPLGTLACDDLVDMVEVLLGGGDQEEWVSGTKSLEHALATKVGNSERWNEFFSAAYTGDFERVRSRLEPGGWLNSIVENPSKVELNAIWKAERAAQPIKTLHLTLKEVCEMHSQHEILNLYQSKIDAEEVCETQGLGIRKDEEHGEGGQDV